MPFDMFATVQSLPLTVRSRPTDPVIILQFVSLIVSQVRKLLMLKLSVLGLVS